jgi:hypothetical protein
MCGITLETSNICKQLNSDIYKSSLLSFLVVDAGTKWKHHFSIFVTTPALLHASTTPWQLRAAVPPLTFPTA